MNRCPSEIPTAEQEARHLYFEVVALKKKIARLEAENERLDRLAYLRIPKPRWAQRMGI